jgi:hypothetical protein
MMYEEAAQKVGGSDRLEAMLNDGRAREIWNTPLGYDRPVKFIVLPRMLASVDTGFKQEGNFKAVKDTSKDKCLKVLLVLGCYYIVSKTSFRLIMLDQLQI